MQLRRIGSILAYCPANRLFAWKGDFYWAWAAFRCPEKRLCVPEEGLLQPKEALLQRKKLSESEFNPGEGEDGEDDHCDNQIDD